MADSSSQIEVNSSGNYSILWSKMPNLNQALAKISELYKGGSWLTSHALWIAATSVVVLVTPIYIQYDREIRENTIARHLQQQQMQQVN